MSEGDSPLIRWIRRIAIPVGRILRIPFLWLLLGFLVFVLQSIWDSVIPVGDGNAYQWQWYLSAIGRMVIGVGVGYFLGFHYRHWSVLMAAALLYFPLAPFSSPEASIGILIGYGWICSSADRGKRR